MLEKLLKPSLPVLLVCVSLLHAAVRAQDVPPAADAAIQEGGPVPLGFEEAVALGIARNVRTTVSRQGIETAEGARLRSLSGLLPNVSGTVQQSRRTANLVAAGLAPNILPNIGNGVFGPFNTFDARLSVTQTIFSLTAIGAAQAGKAALARAEIKYVLSSHLVFKTVGETYVSVQQAKSQVEAFESMLELAKELEKDTKLAVESGVATALDQARAESRVLASETRVLEAKTQLAIQTNKLKALLLIPQSEVVDLITPLSDKPVELPTIDDAVRSAQTNRPDIKFTEETVEVASFKRRAAVGRQVPAIGFGANYGGSGDTPSSNVRGTYLIGGVLSVPIFDGGNTAGGIKEARSRQYEAEQLLRQLKEDADEDVRSAIQAIEYTSQEVVTTAAHVVVAEQALKLSKDRFFTGVSDNLELVAAQVSLTTAQNQYIRSLAKYNNTRIKLAVALGVIEGFEL